MKRIAIILGAMTLAVSASGQVLTVSGTSHAAIEIKPETSTGLTALYVVDDTNTATLSYTSTSGSVTWQRYDARGGGFATDVEGVTRNGNVYSIAAGDADAGYIIDDGTRRYCFWVVNYANHRLELDGLGVDMEQSACDRTVLTLTGSADAITYYTITGRPVKLSRQMHLQYRTLSFADGVWTQVENDVELSDADGYISVIAPLCDTDFRLTGDRFLSAWGEAEDVVSQSYSAIAVSAETDAEQTAHDADNEGNTGNDGDLGGSAPAEITFTAYITDAVVFKEWQFSNTEDFADVRDRYNEESITRTFTEEGTTYARFVCADASGNCVYEGTVYPISIGSSRLDCPNAFSPENQDGVNDEWKVSYTSIVSFECDIFNRWGTKMAHLSHPSQGWDGRYKGKFVPSGVYFYVIKAKGADGKSYDKSGDINIINSRKGASGVTTPGE